jgi:anti-sigma B factor antagonist
MIELDTHPTGAAVVRVDGRLTMVDALAFRSAVAEAVGEAATTVVVDLSACAFMDSSGLGAVIAGLKAARQAGGDLRIAAPSTQVLTVLQLTNLERVLRPFGSVAEALRAG